MPSTLLDGDEEFAAAATPGPAHELRPQRRFHPVRMSVACSQLSHLLKNKGDVKEVLALAATALLPAAAGSELSQQILGGGISIPSERTMRRDAVKMDLVAMLFARQKLAHASPHQRRAVYIMPDASPQGKHEYFLIWSEVVTRDMRDIGKNTDPLQGFVWQEEIMPVTVLGKQHTSTQHKYKKLLHSATLVAGLEGLDSWRMAVKGYTSDQGTERCIRQCPYSRSPEDVERVKAAVEAMKGGVSSFDQHHDLYFLPQALEISGHLHIIWNAFKRSVLSLEEWLQYLPMIRAYCKLLGNKSNSEFFVSMCMATAPEHRKDVILSFRGEHVDWRWEHLEETTQRICDTLPTVREFWQNEPMQGVLDGHEENKALRKAIVSGDLADVFTDLTEVLRLTSHAVGHAARKLEGCSCHEDVLSTAKNYAKRKKTLCDEAKVGRCQTWGMLG